MEATLRQHVDTDIPHIKVHWNVHDIGEKQWNDCLDKAASPFLDYRFLHALESSGCVSPEVGWQPMHLELLNSNGTSGVVPMYLKSHSMGEFVFDHLWADAWHKAGGRYYPKLQICVPFTPVSDRRLLVTNGPNSYENERTLIEAIVNVTEQYQLSSAHVSFVEEAQCERMCRDTFLRRADTQLHWQNRGYQSFENFLSQLAAKKRKNIKRERRLAVDNGLTVEWRTGNDLTDEHWDMFFEFYLDTSARKWGRPYLNREFFSQISDTMSDKILLILAKAGAMYVAGALHFIGQDTLYGRNWGCSEDHPFLHFELCYYQAIEFAIQHQLKVVEGGAQGNYKISRGYEPRATYSAHYIGDTNFRRAVAQFLEEEEKFVCANHESLVQSIPFKHKP